MIYRLLIATILIVNTSFAIEKPKQDLLSARLVNNLGKQVDLSLEFTDSSSNTIKLQDFFTDNKPVVIVPGYYTCPRLCGLVFGAVVKLINSLDLDLTKEYRVISVSFDEKETLKATIGKEKEFREKLNKNIDTSGWRFLRGNKSNIAKLMGQLGFKYLRDSNDFAHSAAIYVITPEGKVSQYFSGVNFSSFDLKLSLIEASKEEIGSLLDHALLFCFRFDPTKGKYTWAVFALLKVSGVLTILLLGGLLIRLFWSERHNS